MRNISEKVRIFLGTEPKTYLMQKVLECSITRYTDTKAEFIPMIGPDWEYSITGIPVGTGFSLRRWMIPAFCNYEGRAIYLDADQLVFSDIWDLWTQPEQRPGPIGTAVWCTYQGDKFSAKPWPQTSVMVIDCAKARGHWGFKLPDVLKHLREQPTKQVYADFMHATWLTPPPAEIPIEWNHLNAFQKGKTRLLHYTKEDTQPPYNPMHPFAQQWQLELSIAINAGYITEDEFKAALAAWGKKEDWRKSNGLHPDYKRFLASFRNSTGARRGRAMESMVPRDEVPNE